MWDIIDKITVFRSRASLFFILIILAFGVPYMLIAGATGLPIPECNPFWAGIASLTRPKADVTRFGQFPIKDLNTDDRDATYDDSTHTLKSSRARLKLYFPSRPNAIPQHYEIHGRNSLLTVSNEGQYRFLLKGDKLDLVAEYIPFATSSGDNLEEARAGANKCVTETLRDLQFVESSRHPIAPAPGSIYGLEADGNLPNGKEKFKMHLYVDNQACAWKLFALGSAEAMESADPNRFLDSLQI